MCGVAAIVGPAVGHDELRAKQLSVLLEAMASRGPDYEGKQFSANVLLGHRLLRILPCALSAQPMRMASSALSIVFNGEIYNFRALRDDLVRDGVEFKTDTDTEVVLALYRQYGISGFRLLKGMFAFIIHDEHQNRVITARDRFGQKPLYVFQNKKNLVFCSSFRAIGRLPAVSHSLNREALKDYLWTLNATGDLSLVQDIVHHPTGCAVIWDSANRRKLVEHRFATLQFDAVQDSRARFEDYVQEAETLLRSAIHLMTDGIPAVACHLSGGIDSSLLSLLCSEAGVDRLALFTCHFDWRSPGLGDDEKRFDEYHHAQAVASRAGAEQYTVRMSADHYRSGLKRAFGLLEEPKGNAALAHAVLADAVSGHSRVCLSGEGADELLGGYIWKLAAAECETPREVEDAYFHKLLPCPPQVMRALIRDSASELEVRSRVSSGLDLSSGQHPVDAIMNMELKSFLAYLLTQSDKLSGYNSIEGRYPFLFDDVADFAFRLPRSVRYVSGAPFGKPVLTHLLRRWLPAEIIERPKVGFVGPEGSWFRTELWDITRSLAEPSARITEYVNSRQLKSLLDAHRTGSLNARKTIWGLLFLNHWLQEWWP